MLATVASMFRTLFLAALLIAAVSARAQTSGPLVFPVDPIQLLLHLLGTNAVFTANGEISGEGPRDPDNFYMDVKYVMVGDDLRTTTDLAKLRSRNACDVAQGRLQEMGMDETVMIRLPEMKTSFVVYPRAQAYIEMPLDWRERLKEIVEVEKTRLNEDVFDGHRCVRYQVHVTNSLGEENDVLVWEATDLKNFPVKLRFEMPPSVFYLEFRHVSLAPPDVDLFHPPLDYTRYSTLGELVRARKRLIASPE